MGEYQEDKSRTSRRDHLIPGRGIHSEEARLERLSFLREKTGQKLDSFESCRIEAKNLRGNIENFIGSIEIPIGIAGPLLINRSGGPSSPDGEQALVYAPIATTEGALVSSITRGASAVTASGGITARALRQRMTRAPMFELTQISEAIRFGEFVTHSLSEIRRVVSQYSNFAKLIEIDPVILGKTVHLRFVYETGDASGQNMTTICTMNACKWLLREVETQTSIRITEYVLEGNLSTDKKASYRSSISGRGTQVTAECLISGKILKRHLKVTPEHLFRIYNRGTSASVQAGVFGFNINAANVVAGIFAATGQDIACVHESSTAQLHLELQGDGLYASMTMPSVVVGTVGGGTRLLAQAEMLQLLGCYGKDQSLKLAETICAFALALDLSTLAAIVGGQFTSAHERLGRPRDQLWLKRDDLTEDFIASLLRPAIPNLRDLTAQKITPFQAGDSLVIESTSQVTQRLCGLFPYDVQFHDQGNQESVSLLLKVKPTDKEVLLSTQLMASLCSDDLGSAYQECLEANPFVGCHIRELKIYEQTHPYFTEISPRCFGTLQDPRREIYVVAMEYLRDMVNLDSANENHLWSGTHLAVAIRGIARFHSIWLNRSAELVSQSWIGWVPSADTLSKAAVLWKALAVHGENEFDWFTPLDLEDHQRIIHSFGEEGGWWHKLPQLPRTLIHNDFNPRNLALRSDSDGSLQLCAYDWELATVHVPQRDLAEFLCFTLNTSTSGEEILHFVELHRKELERCSGSELSPSEWLVGFKHALEEFRVTRLSLYFVAHTHRSCEFLPRVYATSRHILQVLEQMGL